MSDWSDDDLEQVIRALNEPPADLVGLVKQAPSWSFIDLEIELLSAQTVEASTRAGDVDTSGDVEPFRWSGRASDGTRLDIRAQIDREAMVVSGVISPEGARPIALDTPNGTIAEAVADDDGSFEIHYGRRGLARLVVGSPPVAAGETFHL